MTGMADEDDDLTREIRAAYGRAADGWASGPATVYRHLALALVAAAGMPLTGRRVLDLGAGTGVASEVLSDLDARPTAVDLTVEMLRHRRQHRPPAVAGNAQALPFRDAAFDAVVAACCLNHVPDLTRALRECRRVTDSAGLVLASSFPNGADHPAKAVVEEVLTRFGYQRPDWYAAFKARIAEPSGDPDTFARAAIDAGLEEVTVDQLDVEVGLDDPHTAVQWRLNMPHTLDFVATLTSRVRGELYERAVAASPLGMPSTVQMLVLRARVP